MYQASYGFSEDNKDGSTPSLPSQAAPAPKEVKKKGKAKEESNPQTEPAEAKVKGEKRKADPGK